MKPRLLNAFVLFLVPASLAVPQAFAAAGSAEIPFRAYSVADGLTQSEVYDIEQDRAGYLWLTTARGLNRFDGRDFAQITIADGLPSNTLTALAVDADNTIWVGDARGGVSLIRGGRVVTAIDPIGELSTPITDIEIVGGTVVAVADGIGIVRVTARGAAYTLDPIGGQDIAAFNIEVVGNEAWVAAESGLYELELVPEPKLDHVAADIVQVHADGDALWAIDSSNRVGQWTDGAFDVRASIVSPRPLSQLVTEPDGTVWAASQTELFSFDGAAGGEVRTGAAIERQAGFSEVTALFVDREHTLWLSSNSRLMRYLGNRFRHFKLRRGTDPETVWTITEDDRGRMWFGTHEELLLRNPDETLTVVATEHGIPSGPVRDVVCDPSGTLWVGVRGEGLFALDADAMRGELIDGSRGLEILDIAVAGDGVIWFSTAGSGVFRYAPQARSLETYPTPNETSVYTIDVSSDGSVWYGADEVGLVHLTRLNESEFRQVLFDRNHGLRHDLFDHIRLIGEREAWIATEEGGLYRFDDGRFEALGSERPFSDQTLYIVEQLENGTLVVGGEQGLYQFYPGGKRTAHYNQLSGFLGIETNVHATFIDSQDRLWIGTVDGASRMDTSQPMPPPIELTPQIMSMTTSLSGEEISNGAEIAPGQRGAFIEFGAVSLVSPRSVEFSYRLTGVDDEWGAPTTNRTVSYSRIPPGSYQFMVRARYPGGEWSSDAVTRSFTVLPFFWQRPIFIAPAILVFLLMIRAAMVYRTRNIQRLNAKLMAQVAERTRSIEQAKENLQTSNEKLSLEIQERQKADQARAEVETRFRRAFENAPIGMGLLDADGKLFDANPALMKMIWPTEPSLPSVHFADTIEESDREEFTVLYHKLIAAKLDNIDEKLSCRNSADQSINTEVNLSAVRADDGSFLYAVLQVQDVTESLKLTDQLEYQATYDELTGLLNRRAFEAELARAWEHGRGADTKSYLMYMDLDQFKVVNDTSGHAAGDRLLKQVSEMLVESVRANDTVGRLGGDEFAIILWKCPVDVAQRIAESIRASIEAFRFRWDAETYRIGASIGGVPIDHTVGDTGELQQLADAACYAAKEAGRNRVHMVAGDKDSARAHRGQVRWVQRLREAMENNRFAIYGQLIKPLDENVREPERFEILLRLRDPDSRKLIPPGAFIPAAERYGLSLELDEWVVRSLLNALFIYQSFHAEHRRYWINLSGSSIGDRRFAAFLKNMIENSPLPPGTVNFEITETAVIRNVSEAGELMAELRDMGCQFALDDFGSGLSSFSYLKKLPVDYVKIDGMFIRNILRDETDRIFVKSIIDIGHSLNIKTVCEFIENEKMLEAVRELGADYAQGFAIGEPFVLAPRFPGSSEAVPAEPELQKQAG